MRNEKTIMGKVNLTSGNPIVLRAPKKNETTKDWSIQLTVLKRTVLPYRQHAWPTFDEQGAMVKPDGTTQPRASWSFATCLGSPAQEYDSFDSIETNDEGIATCRGIKLPDGRNLHDVVGQYGENADWRISCYVYNWTVGCYQVLQESPTNGFVRCLFNKVWETEAKPATYMIELGVEISPKGKRTFYAMKPQQLPAPLPPIEEDYKKIMQSRHNVMETAEALVQRLGLAKWNPHIIAPPTNVTVPQPAVEANAPGFVDDPFGDDAPAAGSIVGAVTVPQAEPELDPFEML